MLVDRRNGLAELPESAPKDAKAATATYVEDTARLQDLLGLSNDLLRVALDTANANTRKSKREPHKTLAESKLSESMPCARAWPTASR